MKNKISKKIANYFIFFIFRVRIFTRKKMKEISRLVKSGDKILEIGSGGKNEKGKYYFSAHEYFGDKGVDFIMSDINPNFGHKVIDITNFNEKDTYDHILCFHVLDEVFDYEKAFLNLYNALKIEGFLHIVSPAFIPLPRKLHSYFRFTSDFFEEFCKKNNMKIDKFEIHGFKRFPFAYYIKIKRV
jgi:hypothetical protein